MLSPLARQIAALGLALCAVALSLAYPLRNYLEQQVAEQQAVTEQHQLEQEIADLKAQQAALSDPAYIKAEAKRRLQYVSPGDTVYVVKVPKTEPTSPAVAPQADTSPTSHDGGSQQPGTSGTAGPGTANPADPGSDQTPPPADQPEGSAWYESLWNTVAGDGDADGSAVVTGR